MCLYVCGVRGVLHEKTLCCTCHRVRDIQMTDSVRDIQMVWCKRRVSWENVMLHMWTRVHMPHEYHSFDSDDSWSLCHSDDWLSSWHSNDLLSSWRGSICLVKYTLWEFLLKMLHPRNPPNRETQISWLLAVQIQIWDFGSIWICSEEFEVLDLEYFGGVAFLVETAIHECTSCRTCEWVMSWYMWICDDVLHEVSCMWMSHVPFSITCVMTHSHERRRHESHVPFNITYMSSRTQ